jgi:hypothetical protein
VAFRGQPWRHLSVVFGVHGKRLSSITLDEAKKALYLVKESFAGNPATAEKTLKAIQDLTGATEIARLREAIEGIRELTHPI